MDQTHPLYGAYLRFERADRHLAEADRMYDTFSQACIDRVVSHNDYKSFHLNGGFPPIPYELPLVVSDAIHNFRAALDYIVYELAVKDSGKIQNGTQFLIEDCKIDPLDPKRGFDARAKQCLKGLKAAHVDAIERLQPYQGVEWTKTLRDISNPDKHRRLATVTHQGRPLSILLTYRPDGRFRGAEKLTPKGITYDRYDLQFDAYETIAIATSDAGELPIMPTLRRLQSEVCRTIELFKPEF